MEEKNIPWFKNPFIISFMCMIFSLFVLFGQCSNGNKLSVLQKENDILVQEVKNNTETIKEFQDMVKTTIELQFTQNLLYTDAIQKRQMSTQDIQKRFDELSKKINSQKNK